MEASAIPASVGFARTRIAIGAPLLRLRSDDQLVSLFRSGSDEAFRAIHDRYRQRLFAYTRQMLAGSAADAEDAVQEIFVRAYAGLRASDRRLALRAWLYRIAHNRCIDELRRPQAIPSEELDLTAAPAASDPVARLEQRDALRRLIADVQRLPDQQRSALLMRELGGMTYVDVSEALSISVPAVKSLLVRARVGLAQASEARDTACARIREDLIVAHDRGVRASGLARRHTRDCPNCRQFRSEVRGVSRQLAMFVPALGPIGVIAKLLGLGGAGGGGAAAGGSAIAGSAAASSSATVATGIAGGGAAAGVGAITTAGHVVTLLAAAVVTAGGAIELQHIAPPAPVKHPHHHRMVAQSPTPAASPQTATPARTKVSVASGTSVPPGGARASTGVVAAASVPARPAVVQRAAPAGSAHAIRAVAHRSPRRLLISETVDPDNFNNAPAPAAGSTGAQAPANPSSSTSMPAATDSPSSSSATAPSSQSPASAPSASAPAGSVTTGSTTAPSGTAGTGSGPANGAGTSATTSVGQSAGGANSDTVTPATATGSLKSETGSSGKSGSTGTHSGTVAVFTVTGN